jgi:hypothetical protein
VFFSKPCVTNHVGTAASACPELAEGAVQPSEARRSGDIEV